MRRVDRSERNQRQLPDEPTPVVHSAAVVPADETRENPADDRNDESVPALVVVKNIDGVVLGKDADRWAKASAADPDLACAAGPDVAEPVCRMAEARNDDELVGGRKPADYLQHRRVPAATAAADMGQHQEAFPDEPAEAGAEQKGGQLQESPQHGRGPPRRHDAMLYSPLDCVQRFRRVLQDGSTRTDAAGPDRPSC